MDNYHTVRDQDQTLEMVNELVKFYQNREHNQNDDLTVSCMAKKMMLLAEYGRREEAKMVKEEIQRLFPKNERAKGHIETFTLSYS